MILSRIKEFIDIKGVSIAAFEKSIGAANASFAKPLKTGGNIGSDKLENILNTYPDLNPVWLMTGNGEMLIDSNDNNKNREVNREANREVSNKKPYPHFESSKSNQVQEPRTEYNIKVRKDQLYTPPELLPKKISKSVPFYNLPVSAGTLGLLETDVYTERPDGYLELPAFDGCEAIFPIIGVSMEPLLSSGDLIGIRSIDNLSRSWEFIQTDVIYLIITHEDRMIKFIEKATDEEFIVCKSPNAGSFKVFKGDILKLYRVKACVKKL